MIIRGKIGTTCSRILRVKGKRKLPKVGDKIKVKDMPIESGVPWESVRVCEINEDNFYFLERW